VAQRYDHDFFATAAKWLRSARSEADDAAGAGASPEARQAVEQLFSDGLGGGDIVDVFELAGDERPELSVLSDEFLDDIGARLERPELQVALLKKLLAGEIRVRLAANRTQHKRFSDELQAVLDRYSTQQITSAQVVAGLVEIAKKLRAQSRRHEQLGLSREEAAFYDVLATRGEESARGACVPCCARQASVSRTRAIARWATAGPISSAVGRRSRFTFSPTWLAFLMPTRSSSIL